VAACSILAIVACGTILDLDESEPDANAADGAPSASAEGGGEGDDDDDGHVVIDPIPNAQCSPETCGEIGGTCVDGACRLPCADGGGCRNTVLCPENTDCQIDCLGDDACTNLTCSGGRSCSFYCEGTGCHGAKCTSGKCSFDCGGKNGCQEATCTGDECTFRCVGADTCKSITCNSEGSCEIMHGQKVLQLGVVRLGELHVRLHEERQLPGAAPSQRRNVRDQLRIRRVPRQRPIELRQFEDRVDRVRGSSVP